MDSELQKVAESIRAIGGDPVSLLKIALSQQKLKSNSPVLISCISCELQKKCELQTSTTKLIQQSRTYSNAQPVLSSEFYSQIATGCIGFRVINSPVFGVINEH